MAVNTNGKSSLVLQLPIEALDDPSPHCPHLQDSEDPMIQIYPKPVPNPGPHLSRLWDTLFTANNQDYNAELAEKLQQVPATDHVFHCCTELERE